MVFFTCNHCGASVKKNKVEKHYGTHCKNFPSLSCMDCQKDFQGSEYEKHTKCITEDEKYSAKGFVPKPSSNKGEVKQQSWMEVIRSVNDSKHKFSQSEKNILDTIVNQENVPRKKNKFLNFLKSTFNNKYDPTAADNIWKILEEQQQKSGKNQKQTDNTEEESGSSETVPNLASADQEKRKTFDESDTIDQSTELVADGASTKQKKKKSKKNSEAEKENTLEHNGEEVTNESKEAVENGNMISKKGRKEKRKREKYEATLKEIEHQQASDIVPVSEDSPKKKQKKSKKNEGENEAVVEQSVTDPKPSKKKNKKTIGEDAGDEPHGKRLKEEENGQNGVEDHTAPSQENGGQNSKFNWSRKIVELIQTKGGEMPLKRLRKKIIAEYQSCTESKDDQDSVTVKFNKKLMKVPGISVNKEIVQLTN